MRFSFAVTSRGVAGILAAAALVSAAGAQEQGGPVFKPGALLSVDRVRQLLRQRPADAGGPCPLQAVGDRRGAHSEARGHLAARQTGRRQPQHVAQLAHGCASAPVIDPFTRRSAPVRVAPSGYSAHG